MRDKKRTVFTGARFITLDEERPEAECLCIVDGRIECLGTREEVMSSIASVPYEEKELGGGVVYPGFIDTHSHVSFFSTVQDWAECGISKVSIAGVLENLRRWAEKNPEGWIIGYGYDDTGLPDQRHLNRHDLDRVSLDRPLIVAHISFHIGYLNSRALEILGLDGCADCADGLIERGPDGSPTGVLFEAAFFEALKSLPQPSPEQIKDKLRQAMQVYASKGITTFMDGGVGVAGGAHEFMQAYQTLASCSEMPIRGYLQMMPADMDSILNGKPYDFKSEKLRLGGVKLFIDGSIQGYTAALKDSYHSRPSHTGDTLCSPEEITDSIIRYHTLGIQVAVHANGDAGAEIVISAFEKACERYPDRDLRHMLVHAQTVSDEHLRRMKAIGLIPTFFACHVEIWGDRHKNIFLGPERAARIDPCGSAAALGLPFGLHVDSPVLYPTVLGSMHAAINRVTSSGELLGAEQRISVRDAVLAYTRHAAHCCFGDDDRGQLSPGRFADFVLLDRSIEESPPSTICDIVVKATFCGGMKVYER